MSKRLPKLQGAKGKGGSTSAVAATEDPNTLRSKAIVRTLEVLGEGEIKGLVNGAKSIYFDDTPLQNKDGSYNFTGVTWTLRYGLPDQHYIPDFPAAEATFPVGTQVKKAAPVIQTLSDVDFTMARATIRVPALTTADTTSGSLSGGQVWFKIEARYGGGPWVNVFGGADLSIVGKTVSPYDRSYSFRLPQKSSGESAPWDVRVTRLSEDAASSNVANDTVFYALTGVIEAKLSYPDTALIGIVVDAEQFGQDVPLRAFEVYGRIIRIPNNYNPETRVYSGTWNGTFKWAYSNNPAWVMYDLLTNTRFGLGEFLDVSNVDKYALYQIGAYCDEKVPTGYGGLEPRMTFNGVINEQEEAYKVLSDVAAMFRGMTYWSANAVTATQDRPVTVPDILVTRANSINGKFTYQSTGKKSRHTSIVVKWRDPDAGYRDTFEVCEDDDLIERYGFREKTIDAKWCTSRGQARRMGRWVLFTECHETQVVTYRAGLDHAHIRPGDMLAIHDPTVTGLSINDSLGGRLSTGSTTASLKLDRPVQLVANRAYTVFVVTPSGKVEEKPVTTAGGATVSTLNLGDGGLSSAPVAGAVWVMAYATLKPALYRVTSIREVEPHIYEIQGLENQPSKYAYVDRDAKFDPLPTFDPNAGTLLPPTNLTVKETLHKVNGRPRASVLLSWTGPAAAFVATGYVVSAKRASGTVRNYGVVPSTSIDFENITPGEYTFYVATRGVNGKRSRPASIKYTVGGWDGAEGPQVNSLRVKGGTNEFVGNDCTITWGVRFPEDKPSYPVRCIVRVYHPTTDAFLFEDVVTGRTYTYSYEQNCNNGGPLRSFRFRVSVLDLLDRESAPAELLVTNPPPAKITPFCNATAENIFVEYAKPAERDWAGTLFWVSQVQGFNPLTTTPTRNSRSLSEVFKGAYRKTFYVRAAAYDSFSSAAAGLNISDEVAVTCDSILFDPFPPAIPTGLVLDSALIVGENGIVTTNVIATWNSLAADSFARYELFYAVGANPAEDQFIGPFDCYTSKWTGPNFMPGSVVTVRVRSISTNSFGISGFSATKTITTKKNTTPPGAITGFLAEAVFEGASLSWINPADRDYGWTEIHTGDAPTYSAANPVSVAKVPAPASRIVIPLPTGTGKYIWLFPYNTSGTVGARVGPLFVRSAAIQGAQVAAGIIDATKLAQGLAAVETLGALPTTGNFDGRQVYLTTDQKLYRYAGTAWTAAVASTDISGQISSGQLAGIEAAKLIGQVTSDKIASLDGAKLTNTVSGALIDSLATTKLAGTIPKEKLEGIETAKLVGNIIAGQIAANAITLDKFGVGLSPFGEVSSLPTVAGYTGPKVVRLSTDGKLYRLIGSAWVSTIAASDIDGAIQSAQLAGVEAAKITGQLSSDKIVGIEAAKVTGQLSSDKLAGIEATKLIGQVTNDKIASLDGAKLTNAVSGTLIDSLAAAKVSGQLTNATIAAAKLIGNITSDQIDQLQAAKIAGQITGVQITDGAVSTAKLAAASVTAGQIAAGAVLASKLAVASANRIANADLSQGLTGWYATLASGNGYTNAITLAVGAGNENTNAVLLAATGTAGAASYTPLYHQLVSPDGVANQKFPVTGGNTYEYSAYVTATNCNCRAYLTWYKADGTLQGSTPLGPSNQADGRGGSVTGRVWIVATAPADAASVRLGTLSYYNAGQGNWSALVSQPQFALAVPGQTEPSPYVDPGVTTINGGNITAGTVTASKLQIGSAAASLVQNGEFSDGTGGWTWVGTAGSAFSSTTDRTIPLGTTCAMLDRGVIGVSGSTNVYCTSSQFSVEPGVSYEFQCYAKGDVAGANSWYFRVNWWQADGSTAANPSYTDIVLNGPITTAWQKFARQLIAPAGAAAASVRFYAYTQHPGRYVYVGGVTARRAIQATLIENGAVTTDALAANAVTAGKVAANAITAREIIAGAIVASKLSIASTNLWSNGDLAQGTFRWFTGNSGPVASVASTFSIVPGAGKNGYPALLHQGTGKGTIASYLTLDCYQAAPSTYSPIFPATPGQSYEVSAYVTATNSRPAIFLVFYTAANASTGTAVVATAPGVDFTVTPGTGSGRIFGTVTAPANTAYARLSLLTNFGTANADPSCLYSQLMYAPCNALQSEASPFVDPGVTTINGGNLVTNSVAADRIVAKSLTAAQIQANTITAAEIRGSTITGAEIAGDTITGTNIKGRTITAANIVGSSITAFELDADSVTTRQLKAGSVQTAHMVAGTIDASVLTALSVTAAQIKGGTITANEIAAGTITANELAADSVTALKIKAGEVVTNHMVAGTINADRLTLRSITASLIQAGAITANEIKALTITGNELAANAVVAGKIDAGAITSREILAGSITTSKLAVASQNLLPNANFSQGLGNLPYTGASFGGIPVTQTFLPRGGVNGSGAALYAGTGTATAAGATSVTVYAQDAAKTNSFLPVTGNQFYEWSIFATVTNAFLRLQAIWNDANGTAIRTDTSVVTGWIDARATAPITGRANLFSQAPANAATVRLIVRMDFNAGAVNPSVRWSQPMFAPGFAGQTEPSPWVDAGVTVLDGASILAGSIGADRIVAKSITAAQIGAGEITATEIRAGSILASKLAIASTNLWQNGDLAQGIARWFTGNAGAVAGVANSFDAVPGGGKDGSLAIRQNGVGTGSSASWLTLTCYQVSPDGTSSLQFPATPGQYYEASAWVTATNCRPVVQVVFYTAAGASTGVAFTAQSTIDFRNTPGSASGRVFGSGLAPANAAYARITLLTYFGTVSPNPSCLYSQLMYAPCNALQTEASPFVVPGVTTINGGSIITATINAAQLNVNEVFANNAVLTKITAGVLTVGAIKAGMIDAGAVTASKLAVASANTFFNADVGQQSIGTGGADNVLGYNPANQFASGAGTLPQLNVDLDKSPIGVRGVRLTGVGTATAAGALTLNPQTVDKAGGLANYPVVAGSTYEFSGYLNGANITFGVVALRWFTSTGTFLSENTGNLVTTLPAGNLPPSPTQRSFVIAVAPATAAWAVLQVRASHASGVVNPFVTLAMPMFSLGIAGQTEPSPYVDPGVTAIDGGTIFAQTISGTKIIAGTLTTGHLDANSIDVTTVSKTGKILVDKLDATVLTAENIKIGGSTTLASWRGGGNNTEINGGAIAANTISANKLSIGNRNITTTGISFEVPYTAGTSTAAGTPMNRVNWSGGTIHYVGDNGSLRNIPITGSFAALQSGKAYIYWDRDDTFFRVTYDQADVYNPPADANGNKPDRIMVATVSDQTGISNRLGKTIIDGANITTGSISAEKIAAVDIQTWRLQAVNATISKLYSDKITADIIDGGTINASVGVNIGNERCRLINDGWGGRFQVRGSGTDMPTRVAIGNLGPWVVGGTDAQRSVAHGIIIWDDQGRQIINAGGYATNSVKQDALATDSVGTSQIISKNVKTESLADNAVTIAKLNVTSLSAITVDVGTCTAGVLRSTDSKFVINLDSGFIQITD